MRHEQRTPLRARYQIGATVTPQTVTAMYQAVRSNEVNGKGGKKG